MRLIGYMRTKSEKEERFIELTDRYRDVIGRVCCTYISANASFEDLYQEVLINVWQGMDSFRGDAKISTWIYRTALNTCITWYRKNKKHSTNISSIDELLNDPIDTSADPGLAEQLQYLRNLINQLGAIDRAIVTMWLDECPYDEIAAVTGLSQTNVGVRLHRIKQRLAQMTE